MGYCSRHAVKFEGGACSFCQIEMDAAKERDLRTAYDMVDHPSHYGGANNPYEHVKVAIALGWDRLALVYNATKYLWRLGLKPGADDVEDVGKAIWYLDYEVFRRTGRHLVTFNNEKEAAAKEGQK